MFHLRKAAATLIQRSWRTLASRRFCSVSTQLRDMSKCMVCQDECVQIVRCSNNHAVCVGCVLSSVDNRCPGCREARAFVVDTATATMLQACDARMRCSTCRAITTVRSCEHHRAWCPGHRFVCPWHDCNVVASAHDMAAHVRSHPRVCDLKPCTDGSFHITTLLAGPREEVIFTLLGRTTMVLSATATHRRMQSSGSLGDGRELHVQLRAFYHAPDAPSITSMVRQLRVADCDFGTHDAWVEEHRIGVVPPVIASRESVMIGNHGPIITSRTALPDLFVGDGPALCTVPDLRPGHSRQLSSILRNVGLRDIPAVLPPHKLLDPCTMVALVHITLREDLTTPIGSVYET